MKDATVFVLDMRWFSDELIFYIKKKKLYHTYYRRLKRIHNKISKKNIIG